MADKMLDKIAALLKKAETTDIEAEADAYLTQAQTLATRYSVDLAVARQHTAKREQREQPTKVVINIGKQGGKSLKAYVGLFLRIAETQGVVCNIAHNSTYVVAFGMPSDIEVTEILYGSLVTQMVTSAETYLKSGDYKQEMVGRYVKRRSTYGWGYDEVYVEKPIDGRVARANFYQAFRSRVGFRLSAAAVAAKAAMSADLHLVLDPESGQEESIGTDMVLARKDVEVRDFYKSTSTAKGSWSGAATSGYSSRAANAGDSAGRSARLGGQMALGGGGRALAG
jgi:hypothetical protein